MFDKMEETVHDKTPGLNNPETYVLTHNRINTFFVLIFSELNKTQIYKMLYRDSPHHEIEIVMSFNYLNLFKPNEHTENYHIRKPNDETFLFEIGDNKYFYLGEKVITFETKNKIVKKSSELGLNDIKYPFAYGEENIYFMLHQKHIPIQEYKNSTEKDEYQYLYGKDDKFKGNANEKNVEYGDDFIKCKSFHDKD